MTFTTWINSLREAGSKATEGPWLKYAGDFGNKIAVVGDEKRVSSIGEMDMDPDNDFLVLARNEWDTMLTLLERYREALELYKDVPVPGNKVTQYSAAAEALKGPFE